MKGKVIYPEHKPIKHLPTRPVWYGETEKGHKRFMTGLDAHQWSRNTGRPIKMKLKKYELEVK